MTESEEELKSLLMKVKEESEKAGLKLRVQKTKIMACGPITSWQIDGETMKTVSDFIFLCSLQMVTAAMKLKETCSLSRKAMTNLDNILKSREIPCQQRSIKSKLWFFQQSCMDVRVGPERRLSTEELMLLNYGERVFENPLDCKEIKPINPKENQS